MGRVCILRQKQRFAARAPPAARIRHRTDMMKVAVGHKKLFFVVSQSDGRRRNVCLISKTSEATRRDSPRLLARGRQARHVPGACASHWHRTNCRFLRHVITAAPHTYKYTSLTVEPEQAGPDRRGSSRRDRDVPRRGTVRESASCLRGALLRPLARCSRGLGWCWLAAAPANAQALSPSQGRQRRDCCRRGRARQEWARPLCHPEHDLGRMIQSAEQRDTRRGRV